MQARIGLILLCVMLSIGMLTSSQKAKAAEPTYLKIVNPLTGDQWFNFTSPWKSVGDTFIVNITIANVINLNAFQVVVQYDRNQLEFVKYVYPPDFVLAELNPITLGPWGYTPDDIYPGCAAVVGPGEPEFNGSGVLAQLELRIKQDSGKSELSFDGIGTDTFLLTYNASEPPEYPYGLIPFTPVNGHYSLTDQTLIGDVNFDGTVDMRDVGIAILAFNSLPNTPRWNASADLDDNGRIDMRDIVIIVLNFNKHV